VLGVWQDSLSEERRLLPVFLDSDQLQQLGPLFDMVRALSQTLVALETKMEFTRPWCAGEISAASVNSIPIVQVRSDDFIDPDEQFLFRR